MIKMQLWKARYEREKRIEAPGPVYAGVQAGGREPGESGAGGLGDRAGVGGVPKATLSNWERLARVKIERDILKKATACFAKETL